MSHYRKGNLPRIGHSAHWVKVSIRSCLFPERRSEHKINVAVTALCFCRQHGHNCRRKPKWLATFFSRHPPEQQPSYCFHRLLAYTHAVFICMGPLRALSSLFLLLCQPIRPFTTNKALSGPHLHRDRAFSPCPPDREVRGWSAPALHWFGPAVDEPVSFSNIVTVGALSHKSAVGGTAFPCILLHFNHW